MSDIITGAEAMCRALEAEGVDTLFGYPGGAIMPFYDRLFAHSGSLRHILARHEQGAIHAAQGYARAARRVGVVSVTSGPGATNVITGLSDANIDSTPLVVITGQVGVASLGTDAFQETDVVGITLPITKWAYQIRHASEIPWAVARAVYIATTGRPGPVVLDFTKDAQTGTVEWGDYRKIDYVRSYDPDPHPAPEALAEAARLINGARRPLILAGHGVALSAAGDALMALASKAGIPVAATLLGLSAVPSDHPLYMGMLGMHGNIAPNVKTNEADVILAVGMRFDDRVTGRTDAYAPQAAIIHVDIDASEFDKNIRSRVHVHSDARKALEALLPMVGESVHDDWVASFAHARAAEERDVMERELRPADSGGAMRMGQVVDAVARRCHGRAIVVTDVGQQQMFAARYSRYLLPDSLITSGGLGTMGFGLPAAIGAKIGVPGREVVAFMGDGGFQMTLQELGTIMDYRVPVKMVVLNNNFLGNVRQWQAMFYGGRFSATPLLNPDFAMIARAYGIEAIDVADASALDAAVDRMIACPDACLLNVNIETADMVFPMVVPGAAIDDILVAPDVKYQKP